MPNLAQTLKQEISRIARKEVREDLAALRKSVTAHRSEIALLKRTVKELGTQLAKEIAEVITKVKNICDREAKRL